MGDDLNYRINTSGDVSGAKKVEEALAKIREEAAKLNAKGFSNLLGTAAEYLSYAAALEIGKKALEEFAGAQEQVASLDAALAARAQLTEKYRIDLQKLADVQQHLTSINSGEWIEVLRSLTQAGADPENIDKLVEATKNLAGILGGDLQSAAFAVGKALNGEFAAFTRLGFVIDENATQVQKLDELCKQLAQRGGGQLEARATTLKGSFSDLANASDDLLKHLGGALVQLFEVQGIRVRDLADGIEMLNGMFSKTIGTSGELKNATIKTGAAMETAEEIAKRFAKQQENVKTATAEVVTQLQREMDVLREEVDQENKVAAAMADVETKKIDEAEKRGIITPVEAAARRGEVKKKLDSENFRREYDAREKEKEMLATSAKQLVSSSDEENEKALAEKAKLDEMVRLQAEREKLVVKGRARVLIAKNIYDNAEGPEKNAAAAGLSQAKQDRDYSLYSFDQDHPKIGDLATQQSIAKAAEETARDLAKTIGPQLAAINTRREALDRQQKAELRTHGFGYEADRLDALSAVADARAKERGDVKVGPDGSLQGSPAAIRVQQASDTLSRSRAQPGTAMFAEQQRAYEAEIARQQTMIENILKLPRITLRLANQVRQMEDTIAVLQSQTRNSSGRQ